MPTRFEARFRTLDPLPAGALMCALAVLGLCHRSVSAAPPSAPAPALPSAPPLAPPTAVEPQATRFWLSVELIGPRGAQLDAAASLVAPPLVDELPRGGTPPPGEYVGAVETLEQALTWVQAHALTAPDPNTPDRLVPGGELLEHHAVSLTALVLTPQRSTSEPYPWPTAAVLQVPEELGWQPATLAVARTPLFAAPGATLPPAADRYRVATLADSIWLLGEDDICEPDRGTCLSWSRVLVRRENRFFAGWIPSTQIIPDWAWVGGPQERRFALRPGHRSDGRASFALLEQRLDRREAPLGIDIEHPSEDWPAAGVEVLGEELIVLIERTPVYTRHIETSTSLPPL